MKKNSEVLNLLKKFDAATVDNTVDKEQQSSDVDAVVNEKKVKEKKMKTNTNSNNEKKMKEKKMKKVKKVQQKHKAKKVEKPASVMLANIMGLHKKNKADTTETKEDKTQKLESITNSNNEKKMKEKKMKKKVENEDTGTFQYPTMQQMSVDNNTVEEERIKLDSVMNINALVSSITALLFVHTDCVQKSVLIASALVDAVEETNGAADFLDCIQVHMNKSKVFSIWYDDGKRHKENHEVSYEWFDVLELLKKLKLVSSNNGVGRKLEKIFLSRKETYMPIEVGTDWERRNKHFGLKEHQVSDLLKDAIHIQEDTQFTVSDTVLSWANQIQKLKGGFESKYDKEAYVLRGCNAMSSKKAYHGEFKSDKRAGRMYLASAGACNGAAGDRSRALMDLWGVDYQEHQIPMIKENLMRELCDMTKFKGKELKKLIKEAAKDPVSFIMKEEEIEDKSKRRAQKPWNFAKIANILKLLKKGKRPVIGVACGKDAKCSGTQYGAMMVGDADLLRACGFSLKKIDDAYHRCVELVAEAGFAVNKTEHRNLLKTPFMGIFYGQSWRAYTNLEELKKDDLHDLIPILYPDGKVSNERAKAFHRAVMKSFGKKLNDLRNRYLSFKGKVTSAVEHFMPDGSVVSMDYRIQKNSLNKFVEWNDINPDLWVESPTNTYKLIGYKANTSTVDVDAYIRKGFVNMIHATDSLVAKLVMFHLKKLNAKHAINIHDCFRTNVLETHKLDTAIINSYYDLFGINVEGEQPKHLPKGLDILNLWFEGTNKSVSPTKKRDSKNKVVKDNKGKTVWDDNKVTSMRQFRETQSGNWIRRFQHMDLEVEGEVKNVKIASLIFQHNNGCYFFE